MTLARERLRALVADAVEAGIEALVDGLATAVPTGPVRMVDPGALVVDPLRFQFRQSVINLSGTDGRLRDACRWNPALAGVLLVWAEGEELCLVDGHHRLRLAVANGVPLVAVLLVEAGDAREARVLGAMSNLANNTAGPADLAKLLRDTGMTATEVAAYGISRRSRVLADAEGLVPLADPLFARVASGELAVGMGLALAAAGAHPHQLALAREAARRGWSAEQVREAAQLARLATISTTTADGCLPGFELLLQEADSNLGEVLAIRAAIRKSLKQEVAALATVSRKRTAAGLEQRNVALVDLEAASGERDAARALSRLFDQIAGHAGPLADLIRQLATEVSSTRSAGQVVADRLAQVRAAIEQELG